jgi:hypothetical protein
MANDRSQDVHFPLKVLCRDYAGVSPMCNVTFSVYETASFVSGIKVIPHTASKIERDLFNLFIS